MNRITLYTFALFLLSPSIKAQTPEIKFIADTLVVQADGAFEGDPDLATLTFDISAQDKELKTTYDRASASMQKIVVLAEKNGLKKEDVSSGALTVTPFYGGDKKRRAKSFLVQGQIVLRVRDFSKLGALMEDSADESTDFRSLTYSLADEETARRHAVAEAMRRAVGRANAALEQKGQKVGALRYANLDVKQIYGVAVYNLALGNETIDVSGVHGLSSRKTAAPAPPPPPTPQKITVGATVQCAFQIQ